jgi:hypothetical protein
LPKSFHSGDAWLKTFKKFRLDKCDSNSYNPTGFSPQTDAMVGPRMERNRTRIAFIRLSAIGSADSSALVEFHEMLFSQI